jgi:hypothetical protein
MTTNIGDMIRNKEALEEAIENTLSWLAYTPIEDTMEHYWLENGVVNVQYTTSDDKLYTRTIPETTQSTGIQLRLEL